MHITKELLRKAIKREPSLANILNPFLHRMQASSKQEMQQLADDPIGNIKKLASWYVEEISEQLLNYTFDHIREIFEDDDLTLPGSLQNYRQGKDIYIVRNVKGKGFPDYEDVIAKVAAKTRQDEEVVKDTISEETLFEMVTDEVNNFVEDYNDLPLQRAGRSGGYIGIEFDESLIGFQVNEKLVQQTIEKEIKKNLPEGPYEDFSELEDNVLDLFYKLRTVFPDFDKVIALDKETNKKLKDLDDAITSGIKQFENPNYWVELITEGYFS